MIRKLLLLLVVITYLQNTSYSQGAEVYGNAFWQSASNRVVIRLALRNPTGSSSGQTRLMGWRFGIQYNDANVSFAGYTSYMTGLNDGAYLTFIGSDNAAGVANIDPVVGAQRTATISTGGSKVMQQRYINRSTTNCTNGLTLAAGQMAVLIDIYFTLDNNNPAYYHLTDLNYGFGDPEFIAQFLEKSNGGHTGNLTDAYKDIAVVIIREGNESNPYQPFDASSCGSNVNTNPITIGKEDVNYITPINGVLAGKAIDANVSDKMSHVQVQWKSENNQLIDYFEVQRKDNSGEFKTIGLVMGTDNLAEENYEYKDKVTVRDIESSYRIKVVGKDRITTYSSVQKIRLNSSQSLTIKVYPNPSSNEVRINLPDANGIYVSRIYSTEGRMVLSGNVSTSNPSVNIKSLQVGSYFMELYQPKSGMRYYAQFNKQ
jgi:Secretion system C-terminal sorting domain